MKDPARRPPGRPRSEAARRAILQATVELITRDGYGAVTIEAVAARAGAGKQTIYKWWPTKADLVLEAAAPAPDLSVPVHDHGEYRADLRAFLLTAFAMATDVAAAELLRGLVVEAQLRDDFGERFREHFLRPRRSAFAVLTERARQRGDLPATPSPEIVADIVFGVLWYRLLVTREPYGEQLADELVAALT